jgi:hypothetical protein
MATNYEWDTTVEAFLDAIADIDANYHGAGEIDPHEMRELLDQMEREGAYTPIEVFREFQSIESRIRSVTDNILADGFAPGTLAELRDLRDSLARFLTHDQAQYYMAFKTKFDFCQLLLVLGESGGITHARRMIERRRATPTASNAASLAEIRYPQS